jgi:hypothetical protein
VKVRRPDRDAVAGIDAGGAEGPCRPRRRAGKLGKAQGEIALFDGNPISEAFSGASNQSGERLLERVHG